MKRNIYYSLIFVLSLNSPSVYAAASATEKLTFEPVNFNRNAGFYGNKTANLMELEGIVNHLNSIQKDKHFAVPSFFGLSSPEIIAYLQKKDVWDTILSHWEQFKKVQPQKQTFLTREAQRTLADIHAVIEKTFFDPDELIYQNPEMQNELQNFLNKAIEQNNLIMVRSTGREDSAELSNAGGNTSIASVDPAHKEAISDAISAVLSSYFSEKSIGQRLLGQDPHLFDAPFMAVLLQIMIGEVQGVSTNIPQSGVMFSPEAEGQTPNVVVVQATFGHNEGVVNGLVPVDTYYIGPANIIHPLISIKPQRLAATAGMKGLDFVPNDASLRYISTLDPSTVLALKKAAQFIQSYYGKAVDIEFVILNNIIYFVQARPLEAKIFHASYLKSDFVADNNASAVPVIPIGVGNAAVRIISQQNQLIITDNIRQALDIFLFRTVDHSNIKAVLINESAPATSHEATQFRRLGIPVLYVQNFPLIKAKLRGLEFSEIPSLLTSSSSSYAATTALAESSSAPIATNSLLIDSQRSLIIPLASTDHPVFPNDIIEAGWYAHPIAKKVSIMPEFFSKLPETALHEITPEEFFKGISTTILIEKVKTADKDEAIKALRSLLRRVLSTIEKIKSMQSILTKTQPYLILQLKALFAHMLISAHEISTVLNNPDAERLERLYPITFLEALIRQIPDRDLFVNDYSFGSAIMTELQEQKIVKELNLQGKELRAYIVQYAKASEDALTDTVREQWLQYLQALADLPNQPLQEQFARLMFNLSNIDVIPLWINIAFEQAYSDIAWINKSFEQTYSPDRDTTEIANTLIQEYNGVESFLQQLQELQQFFRSFNTASFEDPAIFTKKWPILQEAISKLTTPEFINNLDTGNDLGKIAAFQLMLKAVETFDASIKSLTGSTLYTDIAQKIIRFGLMLEDYFKLLKSWSSIANIQKELKPPAYFKTVEAYLNHIYGLKTSDNALTSSPRFNVGVAIFLSTASWFEKGPLSLTYEDFFTLVHQDLLIILRLFSSKTQLAQMPLPHILNTLKNNIDSDWPRILTRLGLIPEKTGILFEKSRIALYYNIPLRAHSNMFQLIYDLKTKQTFFDVQFIGDNENDRWDMIADTIYILSKMHHIPLVGSIDIDERRGLLTFTMEIDSNENALKVLYYFHGLVYLSLGGIIDAATNILNKSLTEVSVSTANWSNKIPDQKEITLILKTIIENIPERPSLIQYLQKFIQYIGRAGEHIDPSLIQAIAQILNKEFDANFNSRDWRILQKVAKFYWFFIQNNPNLLAFISNNILNRGDLSTTIIDNLVTPLAQHRPDLAEYFIAIVLQTIKRPDSQGYDSIIARNKILHALFQSQPVNFEKILPQIRTEIFRNPDLILSVLIPMATEESSHIPEFNQTARTLIAENSEALSSRGVELFSTIMQYNDNGIQEVIKLLSDKPRTFFSLLSPSNRLDIKSEIAESKVQEQQVKNLREQIIKIVTRVCQQHPELLDPILIDQAATLLNNITNIQSEADILHFIDENKNNACISVLTKYPEKLKNSIERMWVESPDRKSGQKIIDVLASLLNASQ